MNAHDYLNAIRAIDPNLTQDQIAKASGLTQTIISKVFTVSSVDVRQSTYLALKALHERMVNERVKPSKKKRA